MSSIKKKPISNIKKNPNAFEKLIIKYIPTTKERSILLTLKDHFLIYDHGNLTLTCIDCGHKCVCCDNVVIYKTINDFVEHLKIKHNIKC